jgi:ABC-type branched-subunit amino acid transport system substrate-binding protein
MTADSALAARGYVESSGHIPSISWTGSEAWLGEWCFGLPQGSFTEEPFLIANFLAQEGARRIAVGYDNSLIGRGYLDFLRKACDREGVEIVTEAATPVLAADLTSVVHQLRASNPDAVVHLGIGAVATGYNEAFAACGWEPPLKVTNMGMGFSYIDPQIMKMYAGWIGCDQYDERNPVASAFLDRFEKRYGRRPNYFVPGYAHDGARLIVNALADSHPLSPDGVRSALERVKMLPAATGTASTRLSFGSWKHSAWHGAGFLVMREVVADGSKIVFRGSYAS